MPTLQLLLRVWETLVFNNQSVRLGGIMVELWVELHVIPPIFHP